MLRDSIKPFFSVELKRHYCVSSIKLEYEHAYREKVQKNYKEMKKESERLHHQPRSFKADTIHTIAL